MEQSSFTTTMRIFALVIWMVLGSGIYPILGQNNLFQDVAMQQGLNYLYGVSQFGNGMSFYDYDEDGWDDLTLSRPTYETTIYKNIEGSFFPVAQIPSGLETKSVLWFDMNNDGMNDLLTCSKDQGIKLFRNIDNWTFENYSNGIDWSFQPQYQLWGAACSDINQDGLLDIYICNYNTNVPNLTFINQGNFNFVLNTNYFSPDYLRNSFQGSFIPINGDSIPDLYIINDFLQGNNCYLSQPDGGFEDSAIVNGLAIPSDAMSNSWSDFDHDGDWDIYITNRSTGNRLMINDGSGIFSNQAQERNCTINQWCWSGLWVDYDNNGWEDLWVTNELPWTNSANFGNNLLTNTLGNFTTLDLGEFAEIDGYTSAKGDYNGDGRYDIAYQPKENYSLRLLENQTDNANKFIKITLNGVYSNQQAIGSIVQYHHGGLFSQTTLQIGENYLNQNSQHLIIGIGTDTIIDSLIIHWPSGIIDRHYQLQENSNYTFIEAENRVKYTVSMVDSCSADSGFYIQFLPLFNVYTLNSITQNMGGNIYWVPSAGNWNFLHGVFHSIKVPITIHIDEPYVPLVSIIMPTCADSEDGLIAWYTPDEVWYNHLDSLNAGQHTIEIDYGQCTWRDTLLLVEQEVLILDSVQVLPAACISLNNGSLTPYYTTNAPSVTWAIGDSAINGNLAAGSYPINLTSAAGCQISDTIYIPLQIELPSFSGDSAFFCSSEHLNYESFTEQWLFNEWTLTSWDINTTEDSLIIHYMHPNGCTMEHPLELIWIEEPIPMVDTAYTINENWVAWNVALESNFDFNIYWEDGTDLWNNIHPCDDSTYFVLQYQNICAWTFPVATLCVVNEIDEHQELDMEWLFCSNQLSNDMGYCGEIIVFNSLGQSIFLGSTSNGIFLTSASQPRWVKTKEKIYPIRWCLKD
jgi:hypothetical protein